MVGVPGKSSGCITCRRRKVKCDAEKPSCRRCIQSGRECEGYARYPTFLNRGIDGMQRRRRLEEAIPRSQSATSTSSASSSHSTTLIAVSDQSSLTQQVSSLPADDEQIIAEFLELYCPFVVHLGSRPHWLLEAVDLPDRGEALNLALRAMAFSRVGWKKNDQALTVRGQHTYGHALQQIQRALWSDDLKHDDRTLAAGRALLIYEVFEPLSNSVSGWQGHQSGTLRMVQSRGPAAHRTTLGRALFEDIRYSAMLYGVQFRESSFLDSPEWMTEPWSGEYRGIDQELLDIGLGSAAPLMRDLTPVLNAVDPVEYLDHLRPYLRRLVQADDELSSWLERFHDQQEGALFWEDSTLPTTLHVSTTAIAFPNFHIAIFTITYWALRLNLGAIIRLVCSHFHHRHLYDPRFKDALDDIAPRVAEAAEATESARQDHSLDARHELARNILRAMPYCLDDDKGLYGPQKSIFALRSASLHFQRHPDGGLSWAAWCSDLYSRLTEDRGMSFARNIAAMDPTWGGIQTPRTPGAENIIWGMETRY